MSDIVSIQTYIDHQHIRAVARQSNGRAVKLIISRRDYNSEAELDQVVHNLWKRFGEDNIVPMIRR